MANSIFLQHVTVQTPCCDQTHRKMTVFGKQNADAFGFAWVQHMSLETFFVADAMYALGRCISDSHADTVEFPDAQVHKVLEWL